MISKERMTDYLQEIIQIDSVSKKEKDMALRLKKDMEDLGAKCHIDDCGKYVGGNTGNLVVFVEGNVKRVSPFFLSAHMDTVQPGEGIKPVIANGILKSDGTTILGSDDKSGIAIIVEVIKTLKEKNIPHSDIEIAFTICEEMGLLGAKYIDGSLFNSKYGMVLDSSTPNRLVLRCPSSDKIEIEVFGREAHAGLCPEEGISAIKISAEALCNMNLGRIDPLTTANIGIIQGGVAINTVPKYVKLYGEVRSHLEDTLEKQIKHMIHCFEEATRKYVVKVDGKEHKARVETNIERLYHKMDVSEDAKITKLVDQAVANLGYSIKHHTSGGGCDANFFNLKGIECVNLGTGMYELHTVNEYLVLEEFFRSAQIVMETIRLHSSKE